MTARMIETRARARPRTAPSASRLLHVSGRVLETSAAQIEAAAARLMEEAKHVDAATDGRAGWASLPTFLRALALAEEARRIALEAKALSGDVADMGSPRPGLPADPVRGATQATRRVASRPTVSTSSSASLAL